MTIISYHSVAFLLCILILKVRAESLGENSGCDCPVNEIQELRNQIEDLKAYFENKLQEQKNINEEKDRILKKLQHIIVDYDKANNKDAMYNEKAEGIEDDVQQNSQDIEELRIEVYHQEDILNRVSADLKNLNNTFEEAILFIDETRPPVGSIIAWLPQLSDKKEIPQGWQRCDGSTINEGPMIGEVTPDLNTEGRFLRGALDDNAGHFQSDAIQDHQHIDKGR